MKYALAGAVALTSLMLVISQPALSADIAVEPEPVVEPESSNNWYVSLHGGVKFGEDWDDEVSGEGEIDERFFNNNTICPGPEPGSNFCNRKVDFDLDIDTENGWRFGGAVGYSFSSIFAIEGELSYMRQDLDEADVGDFTVQNAVTHVVPCGNTDLSDCSIGLDGDASIWTGMVNLIAGVPIGSVIRPYVGVGAGFAHVSLDDIGVDEFCCADDSDTSFAAQGFVGVDFVFADTWAIGGRYRILHISDVDLEDDEGFDHDLDPDLIHSAEVVLTFGF
jgi:opacity protein-like surface antigen